LIALRLTISLDIKYFRVISIENSIFVEKMALKLARPILTTG
jgi:hypothetical protein